MDATEKPKDVGLTEKKDVSSTEPEVLERAAWGSPIEFVLSCLNYAVGLGNVWRFPYLVYRNGGGAFLIPYIIMLFAMGLPIFFLELIVGQYSGLGPNTAFMRMAPLFHGLGYCALAVIFMITIYYQVIVAWTVFYTYASFDSVLGWGICTHDYNTADCFSQTANLECLKEVNATDPSTFVTYYNQTCRLISDICNTSHLDVFSQVECVDPNDVTNVTHIRFLVKRVLASEEYYNDYAMGIRGATWEHWGSLRWEMVVCLFVTWVICYLCVIKGVATMGKVVYFTSIFPYIVLTALLIRGTTLPGAWEGIKFYITPKWELLLNASVWGDAASQTFYALGIGCGSLVTLSSYNKFNNNCHRDALFVGIVNMLTSVYAGFAIFAILGFMAHELGVPVDEVVQSGPGLTFIAYPEAVIQMPLPQLWAVLFFLMLFILGLGSQIFMGPDLAFVAYREAVIQMPLPQIWELLFFLMLCILGLGSQFGGVEAICTVIIDRWPQLRKKHYLVTLGVCLTCFILALPMCFEGGVFLFSLMDWNTASWSILLIGLMELGLCAWVFGISGFMAMVKEMEMDLPWFARKYWWLMWVGVAPVFIFAIIIFTFVDYTPASYGDYNFPEWVDTLGWLIGGGSLIPLPIFGIYQLVKNHNSTDDWRVLLQPSPKWGPQGSKVTPPDAAAALQMYDNLSFVNDNGSLRRKSTGGSDGRKFDNSDYKKDDEFIDDLFSQVNKY